MAHMQLRKRTNSGFIFRGCPHPRTKPKQGQDCGLQAFTQTDKEVHDAGDVCTVSAVGVLCGAMLVLSCRHNTNLFGTWLTSICAMGQTGA